MTIRLLSFGDKIVSGTYHAHSKFSSVTNFTCGERVISLLKNKDLKSPSNIIVQNHDIQKINTITVAKKVICFDNIPVEIDREKIYNSTIKFPTVSRQRYLENLHTCEKYLVSFPCPKSLAFLINDNLENEFSQGFEKLVALKLKAGVTKIFTRDLLAGIKMIRGVGFGLTPSGNDFIAGLLIALFVLENIYQIDYQQLRKKIFLLSKSNCLLSNSFLYFASKGYFFEILKNFVLSLFYKDKKNASICLKKLLYIGSTSGCDLATGLLMTLKKHESLSASTFFRTASKISTQRELSE